MLATFATVELYRYRLPNQILLFAPVGVTRLGGISGMDEKTCLIGPVSVCIFERDAALATIAGMIDCPGSTGDVEPRVVAFCNAHTVNLARRDPTFVRALDRALVLNDGVGVDIARKLLYGSSFPANLHGTDLTSDVLMSAPKPLRIFLLGSAPGVADRAGKVLNDRFPRHTIVGTRDGFFNLNEGSAVATAIAATEADLVLAGMGQPRQEKWAFQFGEQTGALVMCVGAYLDFTAGVVRRAPRWAQRVRLEWLVRLAHEPRRLAGRYLIGNGRFLAEIGGDYLRFRKTS
ncbi:WecB/TagA/CpsF family glycosyltransferase [Novosphingobium sp. 9U]|uniref:WecB/TagA/CpsF family glycosyltransferase n=1 Tax=Novosphingobium sp. 9U TaxID=2653158 RepID=UPI0012EFB7C4|nr:WecB/TagA/CpsF family glycosyltransferase [Novosphingobium sp. 9U]VWX53341.1 Glycosyltransferase [Novosphingobium sp. 9U]